MYMDRSWSEQSIIIAAAVMTEEPGKKIADRWWGTER